MFGRRRYKYATVVILTLMLTIALAPVAAAQQLLPPPTGDPEPNGGGGVVHQETPPPAGTTGGNGGTTDPPNLGNGDNGDNGDNGENGENGETTDPPNLGNGGSDGMMPPAPSWPPSNLIVQHAATQVQLTAFGDGLQTYFIGTDGTGHSGPYIASFSSLATQHPAGGAVTLFTGTNPGTGKPITIYFLPAEMKIRVSTFYPDTQYDTNKPYVFTVDSGHTVVHNQW